MNDNRLGFILMMVYIATIAMVGLVFMPGFKAVYKWGLQETYHGYYNETVANVYTPPGYAYTAIYTLTSLTALFVGICAFIKHKTEKGTPGKATKTALIEIWRAVTHFNFMYVLIEISEFFLEVPRPYVIGYKKIFCTVNGQLSTTSNPSSPKIDQLCQPFTSFFCAAISFCTLYLYLYMDHVKIRSSLNCMQHVVMTFMCSAYFVVLSDLYTDGQAYLGDILLGVLFGTINAVAAIRAKFGTVFYYKLPNPQREMKVICRIIKNCLETTG